jgi:hypothetical protein
MLERAMVKSTSLQAIAIEIIKAVGITCMHTGSQSCPHLRGKMLDSGLIVSRTFIWLDAYKKGLKIWHHT